MIKAFGSSIGRSKDTDTTFIQAIMSVNMSEGSVNDLLNVYKPLCQGAQNVGGWHDHSLCCEMN